jgi:hypothetical protein
VTDLFDGRRISTKEMVQEAERELRLRLSVYPRQVSLGRMTQAAADRQIRVQRAIILLLRNSPDEGSEP